MDLADCLENQATWAFGYMHAIHQLSPSEKGTITMIYLIASNEQ